MKFEIDSVNITAEDIKKVLTEMSLRHQDDAQEGVVNFGLRTEHGTFRVRIIANKFRVGLFAFLDCYLDREKHGRLLWKMLETGRNAIAAFALDSDGEVLVLRHLEYPTGFAPEHFGCALAAFLQEAHASLFILRKGLCAGEDITDEELVQILKKRPGGGGEA